MTAPGQTYFLIKISLLIQHATSARLETDPTTSLYMHIVPVLKLP